MRFADTTDNDNIVKIIKEFGAISKETAITLEQVIDKGIQDGLCEIYPRGGKDGHPWYPRVSLMMGVGSESNVANHEELYLHRYKAKKESDGKTCFFYWYDESKEHKSENRSKRTLKNKTSDYKTQNFQSERTLTAKELVEKRPDKFVLINGRAISLEWIQAHPEKCQQLYGLIIR